MPKTDATNRASSTTHSRVNGNRPDPRFFGPVGQPSTGQELEKRLKALVRQDLPEHVLVREPLRLLWALPFALAIAAGTVLVVSVTMPWYAALGCSLILGNLYAAFMFFGHETAHGGIVGSRRLQNLLLYFSHLVFLMPPQLWRHWHNWAHHANTNIDGIDPDTFGRIDNPRNTSGAGAWVQVRICPGSGHWLSLLYLPFSFTIHGQGVLWWHSTKSTFKELNRNRAVLEALLMLTFWVGLGMVIGPLDSLYAIILPMMIANTVVMSYVATNHMLSPLVERPDNVTTTLGVTTCRLFDFMHLHFSHHLEHHLFLSASHRYYPLMRESLRRHAADHYLAPTHWQALRTLFSTPRLYAGNDVLCNSLTGRREHIGNVYARLGSRGRGAQNSAPIEPKYRA